MDIPAIIAKTVGSAADKMYPKAAPETKTVNIDSIQNLNVESLDSSLIVVSYNTNTVLLQFLSYEMYNVLT